MTIIDGPNFIVVTDNHYRWRKIFSITADQYRQEKYFCDYDRLLSTDINITDNWHSLIIRKNRMKDIVVQYFY